MPDDEIDYEDLMDEISFEGFDFGRWYEGEQDLLKPKLEEKGYINIVFTMGERDSFGPLTRCCTAIDEAGTRHWWVYG